MKPSNLLLPILGATLLAGLVRYYWPRIETKTVTQTKVVETTRTVTHIVERKDGSKETVIDSTTNSTATKDRTSVKNKAADWHVSAAVTKPTDNFVATHYALNVERRILGPIWAGVLFSTNHEAGLLIGLEF